MVGHWQVLVGRWGAPPPLAEVAAGAPGTDEAAGAASAASSGLPAEGSRPKARISEQAR